MSNLGSTKNLNLDIFLLNKDFFSILNHFLLRKNINICKQEPGTNREMQAAMRDLYKFPLAVYLCAFADDEVRNIDDRITSLDLQGKVMYTYSSWYSIGQSVPCPQVSQLSDQNDYFLSFRTLTHASFLTTSRSILTSALGPPSQSPAGGGMSAPGSSRTSLSMWT